MAQKTKEITVRVTQSHIDEGQTGDANGCAIALALRDRLHIAQSVFLSDAVEVNTQHISVNGKGLMPSFDWRKLPRAITSFVRGFDANRHSVKPFSFKMKVPVEYTKK